MTDHITIWNVEPRADGSQHKIFMLESFTVTLVLSSSCPVQLLRPQLWTNVIHMLNPEGRWHALEMVLISKDDEQLKFQSTFVTTATGCFEFTCRVGVRKFPKKDSVPAPNGFYTANGFHSNSPPNCFTGHHHPIGKHERTKSLIDVTDDVAEWRWGGEFGKNGCLIVEPPNPDESWTTSPEIVEIAPNLFSGNFIAAQQATELGFTSVLNLAAEVDVVLPENSLIKYKKISLEPGAQKLISENEIKEAVRWIEQQIKQKGKVLMACRAGVGRSGSLAIAYLYSNHPDWTYTRTLNEIWNINSNISPHQGLEHTLENLFPRITDFIPVHNC